MQQCACALQTPRGTAAQFLCDQGILAAAQQAGLWIWLYKGIACGDKIIHYVYIQKPNSHSRLSGIRLDSLTLTV